MRQGLVFVAHPDDEFIFAHNVITGWNMESPVEWHVCVATYSKESARGEEFRKSCAAMGAVPHYLELEDDTYGHLKLDDDIAFVDLLPQYDLVFTHNPKGEYGHPHHVDCFNYIRKHIDKNFYVFALNYKPADIRLTNVFKLESPCINIYEREMYAIRNFDLIEEGFVEERVARSLE